MNCLGVETQRCVLLFVVNVVERKGRARLAVETRVCKQRDALSEVTLPHPQAA